MAEQRHTKEDLKMMQALPLNLKIRLTEDRIRAWVHEFGEEGVCVSFSGGKDSTVLLHIVRNLYPKVKAVFSNTGLEYPEIQRFVRGFENTDIIVPEINFRDVVTQFGYPLIGKEVAEAIYYARKLRGGPRRTGNAENCTVKESGSPGRQTDGLETQRIAGGAYPLIPTSRAANRRTVLQGRMPEKNGTQGGQYRPRSRRAGVASGKIGEGGVFSNSADQFGEKSWFNKDKYLPVARDLPVMISHLCCHRLKKQPAHRYQKKNGYKPFLATMAEESRVRAQAWVRTGCNAFEAKDVKSTPMAFWTEQDVLQYIVENGLDIASVYGEIVVKDSDGFEYPATPMTVSCGKLSCTGCKRTGCIFCGFGFHNEKGETRFQRLAKTHPRQYEYAIGGGQWIDNPAYDPTAPKMDGDWQNWNPKKIWVPSDKGLGMGKVFDMVNEIYGKEFYRYG